MNDERLDSPEAIKALLQGTRNIKLSVPKANRYAWTARILKQTGYYRLKKGDKSIVKEFIQTVTGHSRATVTRHVTEYKSHKWIGRQASRRNCFARKYTREDILLLIETDAAHGTLSGGLTKQLFHRAYNVYGDKAYERLANISVAHIYNLRKGNFYVRNRRHFSKTNPTAVNIGERRKPIPNGQPGYIRIDTVHQGDLDKKKGVYHINAVDEVTQFQIIASVEKISERYLIPVLEEILDGFPFEIKGFHSDNGSEFINHMVLELLEKLYVEFTKSRPRRSNDNGLVESKNGSVVRKCFGHFHIQQKWASEINQFNKDYLVPYVNFHRPSHFAKVTINKKGKIRKTYPVENIMTPYEKLKSLPDASKYLKAGLTFKVLDKEAMKITDLESAKLMNKMRTELFDRILG